MHFKVTTADIGTGQEYTTRLLLGINYAACLVRKDVWSQRTLFLVNEIPHNTVTTETFAKSY